MHQDHATLEGSAANEQPSIAACVLQWGAAAVALVMLGGAGCLEHRSTVISNELPFDQAVIAGHRWAGGAHTQKLPALPRQGRGQGRQEGADHRSDDRCGIGQQTHQSHDSSNRRWPNGLRNQFTRSSRLLPFQAASLARAQYLLTGTMTRGAGGGARKPFQINLALVDLSTRSVLGASQRAGATDGARYQPDAVLPRQRSW